jgi:hypothetical protein
MKLTRSHEIYMTLNSLGERLSLTKEEKEAQEWILNPDQYHLFTLDEGDYIPEECSHWLEMSPGFTEDVRDIYPVLTDYLRSDERWLMYSEIREEFFIWNVGRFLWHAGKNWVDAIELFWSTTEVKSRKGRYKAVVPTLKGKKLAAIPWSRKKWKYSKLWVS